MRSSSLATVVAAVLTIDGGVARIDKGEIDGLAAGDATRIYYSLKVGGEERSIEVGLGRIVSVEDFAARLEPLGGASIRPGYAVEIEIPSDRLAPDRLFARARDHEEKGDLETALAYLERLRALLPDDALVEARIAELHAAQERRAVEERERANAPYYRTAANEFLVRGDLERAHSYTSKLLALLPGDAEATRIAHEIERRRRSVSMLWVPSAEYTIGVDLVDAEFYSQAPRFRVALASFWIDRHPVGRDDYQRYRSAASPAPPGSPAPSNEVDDPAATGVTYAEASAYCDSSGNRLPTEIEWEAAATTLGLDGPNALDEWTASWYQPYPGNTRPEKEYGERMRVIRRTAPSAAGVAALRARRFLAPSERHERVGFRCARNEED